MSNPEFSQMKNYHFVQQAVDKIIRDEALKICDLIWKTSIWDKYTRRLNDEQWRMFI